MTELEPVAGWVTVRVEDTCDGLLINADDMKRFGLREDHQYQGHFLPDGRYRIAVPVPVTLSSAQSAIAERDARIEELEAKVERLLLFGGRMANACYNIGQKPKPSHMDMVDLLFTQAEWDKAARAARSLASKIGGGE